VKFQLVIQLPFSSDEDYDRLLSIEETIASGLGGLGIVDGHDFGSGEMNIFIHTDSPKATLGKILELLTNKTHLRHLKAGYKDFNDDSYIALHPPDLKRFSVV
jgi:hypothetical protein